MSEKFQEDDKPEEPFQTAFPEDRELQPGEILCQYGCGKPGQYFAAGPTGGELPRCAKQLSDCPMRGGVAVHAAKRAGRLGRRNF